MSKRDSKYKVGNQVSFWYKTGKEKNFKSIGKIINITLDWEQDRIYTIQDYKNDIIENIIEDQINGFIMSKKRQM